MQNFISQSNRIMESLRGSNHLQTVTDASLHALNEFCSFLATLELHKKLTCIFFSSFLMTFFFNSFSVLSVLMLTIVGIYLADNGAKYFYETENHENLRLTLSIIESCVFILLYYGYGGLLLVFYSWYISYNIALTRLGTSVC